MILEEAVWRIFLIILMSMPVLARQSEQPQELDSFRQKVFQELLDNHIIEPARVLVHYSHTCDLRIDGGTYPVVDVQEMIKNAREPRSYNRIVVFTPEWKPVQAISYYAERPLFCRDNTLYVDGDIRIPSIGTFYSGNVIVFLEHGKKIRLRKVSWRSWPGIG